MKLVKINLNKREQFVLSVILLSAGFFIAEFFVGLNLVVLSVIIALFTILFLYLILRQDMKGTFFYPIFILPFLYTIAFSLFYLLIPSRLLSRLLITTVYAFGLYSLFLTQNIFAVSAIRTINLLRSARIVSFIITILVLYFLLNAIFSLYLPIYITQLLIFIVAFLLNFQSFWVYSLDTKIIKEITVYSIFDALAIAELSIILAIWPVDSTIYSMFLTGIFYAFSGLSHNWFERRLFKGILWEYIWVGFLSILLLTLYAKWGL